MNPEPERERGLSARLSNEEKRELSIAARTAWHLMRKRGAIEDTETEKEFRHRIALQACGRRVSEAIRADYGDLAAAFASMGGNVQRAMRIAERGATEGRRIALHKLQEALTSHGLHEGYAAAICQRQFRVPLAEAATNQLWSLVFTVRNRGRSKDRKAVRSTVKSQQETANPF